MRDQARVVVIGGGVFGTSVAFHLAKKGCRDVVLLDKGELTSGTTFHSVGLVSQFRTSPALMKIMNYTIRLFNQLNDEAGDTLGWHTVGSLRLASSRNRLKALQREVSRARGIGLNVEMISPAEAVRMCPHISDKGLYGAVYVPDDGHIDPSAITYELARQAKTYGVEINTRVRVTGIRVSPGGDITGVDTDRGAIDTKCVVNAAGEWAPRICRMAGVDLPMVPLMHQYLTTKPIAGHELPRQTPVVRDPDKLFYCREDVGGFLVGAFETNPKAWSPEGVSWEFTQELLSPEWELFEPVLEMAMERMPIMAQAEAIELINGPDAFTPDGHYALGPVPGLRGFYVAAGGSINGIAGAGGVGKVIAEWIMDGEPSIDTHEMNVRRFGVHYRHLPYLVERCREVYKYYYHLRYPHDEEEWGRPLRTSPFYERLKDLGAVFGHKNGWERVNYFAPGQAWRMAGADQHRWGWGRPEYFEHVAREVKAARQAAVLIDMTSFGKIEVSGPEALALLQRLAANDLDRPVGRIAYTQFLNARGGIESDVTVVRLAEDRFRIISGTSFGPGDMGWIRMHMPRDGSVRVEDVTEDWGVLCLWGPKARDVLQTVCGGDLSNPAFPYMSAREIDIDGTLVWAQRISYAGELGWELYIRPGDGIRIFDLLMAAGKPHGIQPAGYKALETLRIEKGYLYWSGDITPQDDPFQAGLGFCVKLAKPGFIGREALLAKGPLDLKTQLRAVVLCAECNMYGGESVYAGGRVVDRIRSAAYGHSIGKDIGLVYLPLDLGVPGARVEVEVLGERMAAEVAALPLVDPGGEKLRC